MKLDVNNKLHVAGCEASYSADSASDPCGGPVIFIRNVGKKLVRVGASVFLEPGEKATVPYDPAVEIVAFNNGV